MSKQQNQVLIPSDYSRHLPIHLGQSFQGPVSPKPPTHIPWAYSIFSLLSVVSSLLENRCLTLSNSLAFFEVLVVELAELQALLRRRCGYPDGASGTVASAGLPGRCQRGKHKP